VVRDDGAEVDGPALGIAIPECLDGNKGRADSSQLLNDLST
jgi:hypothetical protein